MNTWERDAIIRVLTDLIEEGESLLTGVTTSEGEYHWKVGVRRSLELLLGRGAPTVQQITNPFSVSFISPATNVKDALLKLKILKADQELGFLPDNLSAAPPAWVYERTRLDILWRWDGLYVAIPLGRALWGLSRRLSALWSRAIVRRIVVGASIALIAAAITGFLSLR